MSDDISAMGHAIARSAQYQLHAADMAFAADVVENAREDIAGLLAHSAGGYDAIAEAGRTFKYPEEMLWGRRESVLEEYPGEIQALEKRIAYLRNPNLQSLKIEQMQPRT